MGHFTIVYHGFALDLPISEEGIVLRAVSGSFPGQTLGDSIGLNLNLSSPKFFFDPHNDPEDDFAQWLTPFLDTQWLSIPLKRFQNRDYRSLDGLQVEFRGEGTHNALTNEDWWEAPGLVATYSDEFFKRADITTHHVGGGKFKADVSGETQFGTSFDISFDAPLAVQLNAYRNSATADGLLHWFDRFLRKDDFVFSEEKRGDDIYLRGAVR